MKKFLASFKDLKVGGYKVPISHLTEEAMSQFKEAIDYSDRATWFDCPEWHLFINVSTSAIKEPQRIQKYSGYSYFKLHDTVMGWCHLFVDEIFNHNGKKYGAIYSTIPTTVGASILGFTANIVSEEGCKGIGCELKLKEPVFGVRHPNEMKPWSSFGVQVEPKTFPIFNLDAGDYGCYILNGSRGYEYIPAGEWEAYINNFGLVRLLRGV